MRIYSPSHLITPTFLMNFPFTVSNDYKNNVLMDKFKEPYDYDRAFSQFLDLYHEVSKDSLVYVLPSEGSYQDQVYVANLGAYLPHMLFDTVLLANFKSPPRVGEEIVGNKFFESMGYEVIKCPYHWEGEADLKYVRDNIYVAPYGQRTDIKSHEWMRQNLNMNVISVKLKDPKVYHLDCAYFQLTDTKAVVSTCLFEPEEIKELEKYVEILDIPEKEVYDNMLCPWTNVVRVNNKILYSGRKDPKSIEEFYADRKSTRLNSSH